MSIVSKDCKPDELLVRARVAGQIEAVFPDAVVRKTHGTDYLYRAAIKRVDICAAMSNMVMNLDYDNFKGSIRDRSHEHAAHGVWDVMAKTQESRPYALAPAVKKAATKKSVTAFDRPLGRA